MYLAPVGLEVDTSLSTPAPRSTATYRRINRFQDSLDGAGAVQAPALESFRYEVRRGDNLTGIVQHRLKALGKPAGAAEVYEQVRRVARQNGLRDADNLRVGQSLDLSMLGQAAAPSAPAPPVVVAPPIVTPPHSSAAPAKVQVQPVEAPAKDAGENEPTSPPRGIGKAFRPLRREQEPMLLAASEKPFVLVPRDMEVEGKGGPGGLALASYRQPGNIVSAVRRAIFSQEPSALVVESTPALDSSGSTLSAALKTGARLSSGFGMRRDPLSGRPDFHRGVDLAVPSGTDIYPVQPGTVTFSGWQPGYGRIVVVQHENGIETAYAHNSTNLAQPGQAVSTDQPIARVGTSGRSTGPHLHFEVRKDGVAIDPQPYLQGGPAWTRLAAATPHTHSHQ